MEALELEIKKIWHNSKVSIRGYLVRKAIKDKQPILVKNNNKKMLLSVDALQRGKIITRNIKSKFPPYKTYDLIDYEWKPNDKSTPDLFNVGKIINQDYSNVFKESFKK